MTMIKILLPFHLQQRFIGHLSRAGTREIGGILMGEHIEDRVFRICELTLQQQIGTWISFIRNIEEPVKRSLLRFFKRTNMRYTKFNYIGEWHSHPSFHLTPSNFDQVSMWEILSDPSVGANFAILLIVKLEQGRVAGNVFLFVPGFEMTPGVLIMEE